MWLSQNAAHQLSHGGQIGAGCQRAKHVSKGAVPPLLQSLLGDDDAHPVGGTQQIGIFRISKVVGIGGLDGDFCFVHATY